MHIHRECIHYLDTDEAPFLIKIEIDLYIGCSMVLNQEQNSPIL